MLACTERARTRGAYTRARHAMHACTCQELLAEKRVLQGRRAEAEATGQAALDAQREEGAARCGAARRERAAAVEARAAAEAEARRAVEVCERLQAETAALRAEEAPCRTGERATPSDAVRSVARAACRLAALALGAALTQTHTPSPHRVHPHPPPT